MIVNRFGPLLRRALLPASLIKRDFAQVGVVISTPPRVKCSVGEKLLHILFMWVVWFTPVAYFHSQIKIWRREYIGGPP